MKSLSSRQMSAVLACTVVTGIGRPALVRIELPLDHGLRPSLLASRLMPRVELDLARLTDSDDRNILDSLYDPKIALGHEYSLPQFARRLWISVAAQSA